MIDLHDIFGLIGLALMLYCYARIQWRRDFSKTLAYSGLNFIGAIVVMVYLYDNWNLVFFISNALWGLISIYGIYRCTRYIRRSRVVEKRLTKRKQFAK